MRTGHLQGSSGPFLWGRGWGSGPLGVEWAYLTPGWWGPAVRGRHSRSIFLYYKAYGSGGSPSILQSSPGWRSPWGPLSGQPAKKVIFGQEPSAQRWAESFLRPQGRLLAGLSEVYQGLSPLGNDYHFYFLLVEGVVPDNKLHQRLLCAGRPLCHCQGSLSGESL